MTTFAAITSLVVWFLVGTCRSKHLITNANHDGRHLNMISVAKVNPSSVHAYMNLTTPLLGSGGGQDGTFPGPGNHKRCEDLDPDICKVIDIEEDCKHEAYQKRCKKTCNLCPGGPDCVDKNKTLCKRWANNYKCNKPFVKRKCRKSCKLCHNGNSPDCVDKHPECRIWARIGECLPNRDPVWMHRECPKSCNVCQGGNGTVPAKADVKCPDDIPGAGLTWHLWDDNTCYAYINIHKTWHQANDHCKSGILTGSSSHSGKKWKIGLVAPYKEAFLKELARRFGHENNFNSSHVIFQKQDGTHYRRTGPWIGGTDLGENGKWRWEGPTEREFSREEIPNGKYFDDDQGPTGEEHCLEIFNQDGFVNDMDCDHWVLPFICEANPL